MSKVRKKKPLGTPGGSFLATNRNKPPSLSAPTESEMNEIDKETIENDDATQELLKGDYEEKLKFEVVLTKTSTATCVRTQAVFALSKLLASDTSTKILPYLYHNRGAFETLNNINDLPHQEAALRVYVSDPTLKPVPKTTTKLKLQFFVRTQSNLSIIETRNVNGNSEWYKDNDIYITLMELNTTDNERIGILIGKAPRITSLPDLKTTIQILYSSHNTDTQNTLPPFQLSIDGIGNLKDQTRTRAVTFTCAKLHARLLTSILQTIFTATTNYQFVSFQVLYSLTKETQINILRQHQSRTYGKTMIDVTLPDFNALSTIVMINNSKTTLRAILGNIRHPDGTLIHFDIDDATRNNDTIMIASPKDMPQLKHYIGAWIRLHLKQTIDWNTASTYSSVTYRLDESSQTSAEAFQSAFPSIITLPTKAPKRNPRSHPTSSPVNQPPKPKPPVRNAWKSLSYATTPADDTKSYPDATTKKPRFPLQQPISTPWLYTTLISNSAALNTNLMPPSAE